VEEALGNIVRQIQVSSSFRPAERTEETSGAIEKLYDPLNPGQLLQGKAGISCHNHGGTHCKSFSVKLVAWDYTPSRYHHDEEITTDPAKPIVEAKSLNTSDLIKKGYNNLIEDAEDDGVTQAAGPGSHGH
jgi:hypothetical protein